MGLDFMNKIMLDYYPLFEDYQTLRNELMDILNDSDLTFYPSDKNLTLGALCREIGEIQMAYIHSFQTFKSDFSYRHEDALTLEGSVTELRNWYSDLDAQLKTAVSALSDNDIETKQIERDGYSFSLQFHLSVYAEALIIFSGKVSIYLKALGKNIPRQWQDWIG